MWILAIVLVGTSSILGSVNFLITIWENASSQPEVGSDPSVLLGYGGYFYPGAVFHPGAGSGGLILLLFDINFGTSFFRARCWRINVIVYQHLFWFYSHPAGITSMILPIFGIMSEVIPVHARKPIFGYKAIAYSSLTICIVGLFVWVHHMFTSGTPPWMRIFFTISTLIVAVPTGIKNL